MKRELGHPWRRLAASSSLLALLLLAMVSAAGCQQDRSVNSLKLTIADSGKTVAVHPGEKVVLTLDENASTGYTWAVVQVNETILALTNSVYSVPTFTGVVGEGGTHIFTFTAKQAGTSPLDLKEWRPWEGDSSIIAHYDVTIQVR